MKNRHIAFILLVFFLAGALMACNKGPKERKITGTLESWSTDPAQVVIDGITYPVAEGMEKFAERAEKGRMYEFTIDVFGNVIRADPL